MTTTHTSTGLERRVRGEASTRTACLRLRWAVAPSAFGLAGRAPAELVLELHGGRGPLVMLNGTPLDAARDWAAGAPERGPERSWDRFDVRRVGSGAGQGLLIIDAAPHAIAILDGGQAARPLHVACDLPRALGLRGGRYELIDGQLSA
ncbi:MAG: hypothetical protein RIE32_07900 [Phycisphaerales bacterium]